MRPEQEILTPPEYRTIQAVSAVLISDGDLIYSVVETTSRPDYGKYAGMRTIPMETIKPDETREDAVMRLIKEEVGEDTVCVNSLERVGIYGIGDTAATCFLIGVSRLKPQDASIDGVIDPKWVTKDELMNSWTRAGVREMLDDSLSGLRDVYRCYCTPV